MLEPCPCSCTLPPGASPPVRPLGTAGLRCGGHGRGQGPFSLNKLHPPSLWPGVSRPTLGLNFLTCEMGRIRSCFLRCLEVVGGQVGAAGEGHRRVQLWTLAREDVARPAGSRLRGGGSGFAHIQTWLVSPTTAHKRTPARRQECTQRCADGSKDTGWRDNGGESRPGRGACSGSSAGLSTDSNGQTGAFGTPPGVNGEGCREWLLEGHLAALGGPGRSREGAESGPVVVSGAKKSNQWKSGLRGHWF